MASKPFNISAFNAQMPAFVAKLLAPLPEGEEPAETAKFLRVVCKDMADVWRVRALKVHRARALWIGHGGVCDSDEHDAYFDACDVLMMTPAPGKVPLGWKLKHRKFKGGCPDWEAAIARDEAWIAKFEAAVVAEKSARVNAA